MAMDYYITDIITIIAMLDCNSMAEYFASLTILDMVIIKLR